MPEHVNTSAAAGKTASRVRMAGLVLALAVVAACTPKPKYYKSAEFDGIGPDYDRIAVDVFVSKPPKFGAKTALDLSAEGQAAYIEAFAGKPDSIAAALATPIKRGTPQPKTDKSRLAQTRRLTFTVATTRMLPADRIVEAHVTATAPADWRFVGWSGFSVVESDIKAATIVDTANARLKAAADLDLTESIRELIGLTAETEVSRGRTLTRDVNFNVVEFLPRLTDNTAEFILNAPFPKVNLSGSYTVDVKMQYTGPEGWVKTTDIKLRQNGAVGIDRDRTVFPANAAAGTLDVHMPYVVRRVSTGESALTLKEDDDSANYHYVGGSISPSGIFAKTGSEIPSASRSLELLDATRVSVSALFLDGKPLKIFVPGADQSTAFASCIISADGGMLADFALWVTEDPDDRIAVADGGDLVYVLMMNDDNGNPARVDPTLIRAVNGGTTIEVRRFDANHGPEERRISTLLRDDCDLDVWKPE